MKIEIYQCDCCNQWLINQDETGQLIEKFAGFAFKKRKEAEQFLRMLGHQYR